MQAPSILRQIHFFRHTGCRWWRFSLASSTLSTSQPGLELQKEGQDDLQDAFRRQRRTEWKRRQRGQTFLDHLIVTVRGGKGGDGCAAFHREKFKPFGPPSGGNGGRGGDVYILPTPHLTTLSSVSKRIRGLPGGHGQGTWQNGKNGAPIVIEVPLGTVVRELTGDDPRRSKDEFEAEEENLEGLSTEEADEKRRANRWVHYPRYADMNIERDAFKEAEAILLREEKERRFQRRRRAAEPIFLDLDATERPIVRPDDAPLGTRQDTYLGHLIASGGAGGLGNPHFLTPSNRSPKFAMRGAEGERVTLSLELKLLADIGLVGMPNAGKSTLLRALTGGRARSEVAGYAFTTLNPVVGVVRVAVDGGFAGEGGVHEETAVEQAREQEMMRSGALADAPRRNEMDDVQDELSAEVFRFTIADNPGLIERASENAGLGHSFLRAIERSHALVYVVDLSGPAPWDDLRVLRDELEKYKPGLSDMAQLVVANKADLIGGHVGDVDRELELLEAWKKLSQLEEFVRSEMHIGSGGDRRATGQRIDVVPVSAKFSLNLRNVVRLLRTYVEDARAPVGPGSESGD